MQRVARSLTVPVARRYRVYEPVAEVELGETFLVETSNANSPIICTPEDANPQVYREREETGPIWIRGLHPGDVVAIHVEAIEPVGHAFGGWWPEPGNNAFLPIDGGRVCFPGGLWAPLAMMIGDVYVTPVAPAPNPWDNGGNMDFRDVAPGNTLCLRVEREGGLLVLGDVHAVQGDGEVLGLGAECAADVTLRITKDATYLSDRPLIAKDRSFVALAARCDYAEARELTARDAARVLARLTGCAEQEAYLYVTTVGDLRNGAVWAVGRTEPSWARDLPVVLGLEVPLYPISPTRKAT